jgi:hypothetical protein
MTHRTLRHLGVKCPVCGAEAEDARCYTPDDEPREPHAPRVKLAMELRRADRADAAAARESAALQAVERELELERTKNKHLIDLAETLRRERDADRARIDRFTTSLLAVVGDRLVED